MDWLFLQLVDSAFPAGGFAHSNGLEAALAFRGDPRADAGPLLERHLDELLLQAARTALPFVREACVAPARLPELDALCDATLASHVANRASRAQGRALASAATRVWPEACAAAAAYARADRAPPTHHAPVLGAVFGALGQSAEAAQAAYVHGLLRGALSAAVRLGLVGPLLAQRMQCDCAPACARAVSIASEVAPERAAQPSPLLELYATLHDRLDARLFQS